MGGPAAPQADLLPACPRPDPPHHAAEARTNLPALALSGIPCKWFIVWEDTTKWPAEFRKLMETPHTYADYEDLVM